MKSLLRMSEEELAELEAGEGFRSFSALAVATLSGLLALAGMMLQYAEGDDVPIAGMDTFEGQCLIAAVLGSGMLILAFMVRSVIVRRLQWAVLFSLALHLFLCVAMQVVVVDVPVALVTEVGDDTLPPRDMTLPDYGGAETQTTQELQEWQQPADMTVPETQQQQLQRQQAEMQLDAELDPVEVQRQVAEASTPERQQQQQERLEREQQLEMERNNIEAQADAPEAVAEPEVQTVDVEQPNLEARQMQRSVAEQLQAARQLEALQSQNDPAVEATQLAAKQNAVPENDLNPEFQPSEKTSAAAMAQTAEESVEVASAAAAAQMAPTERSTEAARQAAAQANIQNRSTPLDLASNQPQVQSLSVARTEDTLAAAAVPSSGGAAAMQRSQSVRAQTSAANTQASDAVQVAAAGSVSAPALSAAQVASEVSRGQASIATNGGSTVPLPSSAMGTAAARSQNIGRSQAADSGPAMGAAAAQSALTGTGNARAAQPADLAGATGSGPQQVAIAGAAASADAVGRMVANGPAAAAAAAGRSRQSLPASSSTLDGMARTPSAAGTGLTIAANGGARAGLSAGSANSDARLGQALGTPSQNAQSGQPTGGSGMTGRSDRRPAAAAVPEGLLQAERTGALVIAGPQAPAANDMAATGSLRGPRDTSLPRQASGLPLRGPAEASLARSRPGLPSRLESSRLPGRSNPSNARPAMATASEVASLIRRSVPGVSGVPESRISAGFSLRTPAARKEAVEKLGGSDASEAAVDRGLEWLAAHQYAAGNWSIHDPNCQDHECAGFGTYEADPAATGMALLAFLGAGHTHKTGLYQQEVGLGLQWLLQNQKSDGDLFAAEAEFSRFYSHGIAAIALCEAYGMTKDPQLQQPAQQAINYIVASQHPEFGGWRYKPRFESDTSVSGWQLMALKSGEMAGLKIPRSAYAGVANWLDSVEEKSAPGRFRYHPTKEVTEPMTAEGLLMRQYLGADRQDQALLAGASYLKVRLPRAEARDVYYWYYATQVMFHMQGEHWEAWNAEMRDMLVATQEKGGPARGSWDAASPTKDTWGRSGGRHYVTCLNLLMLEVYYRHLPLYIELNEQ